MYIEDRLYSESDEEVLYSITLDEEEARLYSVFQKEFAGFAHFRRGIKDLANGVSSKTKKLIEGEIKNRNEAYRKLRKIRQARDKELLKGGDKLVEVIGSNGKKIRVFESGKNGRSSLSPTAWNTQRQKYEKDTAEVLKRHNLGRSDVKTTTPVEGFDAPFMSKTHTGREGMDKSRNRILKALRGDKNGQLNKAGDLAIKADNMSAMNRNSRSAINPKTGSHPIKNQEAAYQEYQDMIKKIEKRGKKVGHDKEIVVSQNSGGKKKIKMKNQPQAYNQPQASNVDPRRQGKKHNKPGSTSGNVQVDESSNWGGRALAEALTAGVGAAFTHAMERRAAKQGMSTGKKIALGAAGAAGLGGAGYLLHKGTKISDYDNSDYE